MDELGVDADRDQLGVQFFELLVLLCQSSEFGRSDEGKIGGVEEKNRPFFCCLLLFETDLAKITF